MKKIPLTQGKFALVDDEDYEWLNQIHWDATKSRNTYYARSFQNGKRIKMHRMIMKVSAKKFVDHIDGDGLNNQKSNLRICTQAENARNARIRNDNTSGYKGVSQRKDKWYAQVRKNGKHVLGKLFDTAEEAAREYDEYAKKYHGIFAKLNFSESE